MRHSNIGIALTVLGVAVALAPLAHASSRGIRTDAPCPFSGGGNPWSPVSNPSSPFDPGAATANFAELTGGATSGFDQLGNVGATALSVDSGIMYNWYSAPIPDAGQCSGNQINGSFVPSPIEQVMVYSLSSGDQLAGSATLPSDLTEIEFNYGASEIGKSGTASFKWAGITYMSTGGVLPATTGNDFLFNANGSLYGAISEDGASVTLASGTSDGLPEGWTKSSAAQAPEFDPGSIGAALTLLGGSLLVLRGRRLAKR